MYKTQLRKIGFAILYILILFQFEVWLDFGFGFQDRGRRREYGNSYHTFTEMVSTIGDGYRFRWALFWDCLILRPILALIATIVVAFMSKYASRIVDIIFDGPQPKPTPVTPGSCPEPTPPKQEPKHETKPAPAAQTSAGTDFTWDGFTKGNIDETNYTRVDTPTGFKLTYKKKVIDPDNPKDMKRKLHIDYNLFALTWTEYYDRFEYEHHNRDYLFHAQPAYTRTHPRQPKK